MYIFLISLTLLPLFLPSFAIVYRYDLQKTPFQIFHVQIDKDSVFNVTTAAMFTVIGKQLKNFCSFFTVLRAGLSVPLKSAANLVLLVGWEGEDLVLALKPILSWIFLTSIFYIGFFSLLYKFQQTMLYDLPLAGT